MLHHLVFVDVDGEVADVYCVVCDGDGRRGGGGLGGGGVRRKRRRRRRRNEERE